MSIVLLQGFNSTGNYNDTLQHFKDMIFRFEFFPGLQSYGNFI